MKKADFVRINANVVADIEATLKHGKERWDARTGTDEEADRALFCQLIGYYEATLESIKCTLQVCR